MGHDTSTQRISDNEHIIANDNTSSEGQHSELSTLPEAPTNETINIVCKLNDKMNHDDCLYDMAK